MRQILIKIKETIKNIRDHSEFPAVLRQKKRKRIVMKLGEY